MRADIVNDLHLDHPAAVTELHPVMNRRAGGHLSCVNRRYTIFGLHSFFRSQDFTL
jgi:hypothetical protein